MEIGYIIAEYFKRLSNRKDTSDYQSHELKINLKNSVWASKIAQLLDTLAMKT